MTPKVSVILPVHNRADVLPRAIESVLEQDLRDFELIVVDDGSTDASIVSAKAFDDLRLRIIALPENVGPSAARNAGILEARAPLVAFLDSDDRYLPDKLRQVCAEFERRPGLDLLVDSFVKVQSSGKQVRRLNPLIDDPEAFRRALFTRRLWKATPAISARREIVLRAGLFDETLRWLEDFDLLIRVSKFANCAAIDRVLWIKHWDAQSISGQDHLIAANLELVRRHPQYLTVPQYRPGLAYIVRLALWRRLKRGDVAGAVSDLEQLAHALGTAAAGQLLLGALLQGRRAQ